MFAFLSRQNAPAGELDYNEEARRLWAKLNLEPDARTTGKWNLLDSIYKHPTGGGTIYVGNQMAAESLHILHQHGITHVVNCTSGVGKIPDYHVGKLMYHNFQISNWSMVVDGRDDSILEFTREMFAFIECAISSGRNVLIHCLAGAHRAGTTGIACLIHFAKLDAGAAVKAAKTCRPIIDPIGRFPDFLARLAQAEAAAEARRLQQQR